MAKPYLDFDLDSCRGSVNLSQMQLGLKKGTLSKKFLLQPDITLKTISTFKSYSKRCIAPPIGTHMQMTDRERDIWEVKELRTYIEPQTEPSKAIAHLQEARDQQREVIRLELCSEIEKVNATVEEKIKQLSADLKTELHKNSLLVEWAEEQINHKEYPELTEKDFVVARENGDFFFRSRRDVINLYKELLLQLEAERSQGIKPIFRQCFQKLKTIIRRSPEVNDYFEKELLEYNQAILNNTRCYTDIHLQLLATGDDYELRFRRRINCVECLWKEFKKPEKALDHILPTPECSKEVVLGFTLEEIEARKRHEKLRKTQNSTGSFRDLILRWADRPNIPNTRQNILQWSDFLTCTLLHLDGCSKRMMQIFKKSLSQVLLGHKLDLKRLHLEYLAKDFVNTNSIQMMGFVISQIITKVKEVIAGTKEEEVWQDTMDRIVTSFEDISVFLGDAVHLWERHFLRLQACTRLVTRAVEKQLVDCARATRRLEVRLNVALDALRQAHNKSALKVSLKKVNGRLDEIRHRYQTSYKHERRAIFSYPGLARRENEAFQAETQKFFVKHPRGSFYCDYSDSQSLLPRVSFNGRSDSIDNLPLAAKTCMYQMEAVYNWKFGLWEGLEHYAWTCDEDVAFEARRWSMQMMELANDRMKFRMALHRPRYERVKLEVHNLRKVEIRRHADRLTSHKEAVLKELKAMTDGMDALFDGYQKIRQNTEKKLRDLAAQAANATVPTATRVLIKKIEAVVHKFNGTYHETVEEYREACNMKVIWLCEANTFFIEAIKLFSEGGDFSAKEALAHVRELDELCELIEMEGIVLEKEMHSTELTFSKQAAKVANIIKKQVIVLHDDVTFSVKAVRMIRKLQVSIKKEVLAMKSDLKAVHKKVSEIETAGTEANCITSVVLLGKTVKDLTEILIKKKEYLQLSPAVLVVDQLIDVSGQKATTTEKPGVPAQVVYRDFLPLFFGTAVTPPNSDTFLSSICFSVWKVFVPLQELAQNFYSGKLAKSSAVVKTDILQSTYETFMEEMLSKFQYYFIQCKEAWLGLVREYLEIIILLKEVTNAFTHSFLGMFQEDRVLDLSRIQEEFLSDSAARASSDGNHRSAQERRLMPLHGYPGNRAMLEELDKEIQHDFEGRAMKALDDFFGHKARLEEQHSSHGEGLKEMLASLDETSQRVFALKLSQPIMQQVEDECRVVVSKLAGLTQAQLAIVDGQNAGMPIDDDQNLKVKTAPTRHKLSLDINTHAAVILTFLGNLRLRLPAIQDTVTKGVVGVASRKGADTEKDKEEVKDVTTKEGSEQNKQRVNKQDKEDNGEDGGGDNGEQGDQTAIEEIQPVVLKPVDINAIASNMTKEYEDQLNKNLSELNQELITYKRLAKEWIKKWKTNVVKVKEIYSVRHDCKST